ncbi:MAG: Tat pathway signal protein [Clostridia bacterium]|nr:Tat pathway signal protein [Clostridia bacterium]
MAKELIWAYLIHLSNNFGGDYPPGDGGECKKTEPLVLEKAVWTDALNYLHGKNCCNTILIDVNDGVEYESHPEINAPGAMTKAELADEIARLRKMGFKVYPKLNFSACHDKWLGVYSRMLSTPLYYQVCKDLIDEVSELFGKPELFHLGLDEECISTQANSHMCIIRGFDMYWHDAHYLFKCVEANGARPWMWADHIWHNPPSRDAFVAKASKDVLYSNWYYGNWEHTSGWLYDSLKAYEVLEAHGFDQIPCGSTTIAPEYCHDNMKLTVENCTKNVAPERLYGFLMTSWAMPTEKGKEKLFEQADAMAEAHDFYYGK